MLEVFRKMLVTIITVTVIFIIGDGNIAEADTKGSFGNEGQFCTATINQDLWDQRNKKYKCAYVNLNIYQMGGKVNNWRKIEITMRDENNNIIWQGIHIGGKLKLGNDHRVYKIYVRDHKRPSNFAPGSVDCQNWEITAISGCSVH